MDKMVNPQAKWAILLILASAILPVLITGTEVIGGLPAPDGENIPAPDSHDRMSESVLLIILDGLTAYVMSDPYFMPNMANWTNHGAELSVTTGEITLTGACSIEMSTGRHATPIDAMRNWEVTYDGKDDAFHYLLERNETVAFTGFYVWSNIFTDEGFVHETVYDNGFSDTYEADDKIIANVERWVEEDNRTMMVAHLGGTDHAGHIWGIHSTEYPEKMLHLDNQLDSIRKSIPDDWTILITADHGMNERGGHAISTGEEAMQVNLLASGAGIKTGATHEIVQRDIASLPIVLLDLPFPVSADSRIPLEILDISEQQAVTLEEWNWHAHVERQTWLKESGMQYADVSTDEIEWSQLPQQYLSLSIIDIIAFISSLAILCYAGYTLAEQSDHLGIPIKSTNPYLNNSLLGSNSPLHFEAIDDDPNLTEKQKIDRINWDRVNTILNNRYEK